MASIVKAAHYGLLFIAPHNPVVLQGENCLAKSYYGTQGQQDIFVTDESCLQSTSHLFTAGHIMPVQDHQQLVWLERKAVDESVHPLSAADELDDFLIAIEGETRPWYAAEGGQTAMGRNTKPVQLLGRTPTSAVFSISPELLPTVELGLPPFWDARPLPDSPVDFIPVPSSAVERVRDILSTVKFDPVVASIVNNISVAQLHRDVTYLTGEDTTSPISTRHSFTEGALLAAHWLKEQFESTGAVCELKPFLEGFAPNVVCLYAATEDTDETVLISAHYDSRGSFGSTRAPGGDDDGSGVTGLLGIARTIGRKGITFRKNVQLVAFAGEEQGLYGSHYYAIWLREQAANLILMVQADMTAYHAPGEPSQLGLPATIGTPEVAQLVSNLSAIYSPEIKVGYTAVCCSDHQSFHTQGFPATQLFERAGSIADPMYHNSGDLSDREGYDFDQLKSLAKVQFATILHTAGYDISH